MALNLTASRMYLFIFAKLNFFRWAKPKKTVCGFNNLIVGLLFLVFCFFLQFFFICHASASDFLLQTLPNTNILLILVIAIHSWSLCEIVKEKESLFAKNTISITYIDLQLCGGLAEGSQDPSCWSAVHRFKKFIFKLNSWPSTRLFYDTLCTYSIIVGFLYSVFAFFRLCIFIYAFSTNVLANKDW